MKRPRMERPTRRRAHPPSQLTSPLHSRVYIGMRAYEYLENGKGKMRHQRDVGIVLEYFTAEEVCAILQRLERPPVPPVRVSVSVRRFRPGRRKLETVKAITFEGRTPQELHDAIVAHFQKEATAPSPTNNGEGVTDGLRTGAADQDDEQARGGGRAQEGRLDGADDLQ